MTRLALSLVSVFALIALAGCASEGPDDREVDEENLGTKQDLLEFGCSMASIRNLQAQCRTQCGPGGSAGIHWCVDALYNGHSAIGECACRQAQPAQVFVHQRENTLLTQP